MKISLSEGTWDKSTADIVAIAVPSGKTKLSRALGRIEVVTGKGDGAVAVKRACLAGVPDTHTFPFEHHVVWDDPTDPGSAALRQAVLHRLGKSVPDPRLPR